MSSDIIVLKTRLQLLQNVKFLVYSNLHPPSNMMGWRGATNERLDRCRKSHKTAGLLRSLRFQEIFTTPAHVSSRLQRSAIRGYGCNSAPTSKKLWEVRDTVPRCKHNSGNAQNLHKQFGTFETMYTIFDVFTQLYLKHLLDNWDILNLINYTKAQTGKRFWKNFGQWLQPETITSIDR